MARRVQMRIGFLILIGLLVSGAIWYARSLGRFNVLLITLDTTSADRLGCYGYQTALTPVLDRLAERGVLFERAYAPVPLTLPSHASMMTGLYPPEHGLRTNGQAALPPGLPTLATELEHAGYNTAAFVAAFVLDKKFGLNRGFRVYDDNLSQADPSLEGHHRYRDGRLVVDAALRWLRLPRHKPFFCWVHLFDPHYPYLDHADRFGDRFADNPYDAEIAYVDEQVGRLIAALEKSGSLDRTIIIVAGDHGESLGEHGERTHSMTLYDATLRVPLLIAAPGRNRAGHRVPEPVSLVDLCPTLLDGLGYKPLPNLSGHSLWPVVRGEAIPSRPLYAETDEPYQVGHWSPQRAWITPDWKYIRSPEPELYDLSRDPRELENLAAQTPDKLAEFERELAAAEQQMERRFAQNVALTDKERRALTSLGYSGRHETVPEGGEPLKDIKQMLPYYNLLDDADEMMDAGRYDLAEPVLRKILAADDGYFMAHGSLGRCLLRLNQTAEAIGQLRRCIELDPGADRVRSMLGAALLIQGEHQAAADELEIALQMNPELYEAQYNLGLALEKLGRVKEAIERYRICVDLRPEEKLPREALERLESD